VSSEALRALLGSAELAAGLLAGILGLGLGLLLGCRHRHRDGTTAAVAGLLFAVGFVLALGVTLGLPAGLVAGLGWLGGVGMLEARRRGRALAPFLAIAGAWLLMYCSDVQLDDRMRLVVGAGVVVGGWLLADFDARWRQRGLGPVLLTVSIAGVFSTVPDTETALVALGTALPLTLLGWPWPLASLGRAGAYAAVGALLWVVATGGLGRASSVVGGLGCLALVVVEPLARLLSPGGSVLDLLPTGRLGAVVAGGLHLGLVYVAARVAGFQASVAAAAWIVAAELGLAVALAAAVGSARRRRSRAR
jgi:hypothetical protein